MGRLLEFYYYFVNCFVVGFIGLLKMNFLFVCVLEVKEDVVKIEMFDVDYVSFWIFVEGRGLNVGDNVLLGICLEYLFFCEYSEICIKGMVKVVE